MVFFDQFEGIKLVGSAAKDGGDPDRTVRHIKKFMDDPGYVVEIDGERWTPTEISALFLAKLRKDCATLFGPIDEVVITVPANFNEFARKALAQLEKRQNAAASILNSELREEAEQMLEAIVHCREKYVDA